MPDSIHGVGHADSMDSHDSSPKQPDKKKNRRPANTAFRQQRLKAWQPILTPKTVLPLFFTIGIIFAPIGGLLLWASSQVQEIMIDYSGCKNAPIYKNGAGFEPMNSNLVSTAFKTNNRSVGASWAVEKGVQRTVNTDVSIPTDRCYLQFEIPEDISPPVLFYYRLSNFHQNHRRYVDSQDAQQLNGAARSWSDIEGSKCTPLYGDSDRKKPYYPCGLIANSMFNDTFTSPQWLNPPNPKNNEPVTYQMENNKNIAWGSDGDLYSNSTYKFEDILPPPNWALRYPNNYTAKHPPPNLKEWQAFQVWMRTAGLPVFSKLYQRNDVDVMKAGQYQVIIDDYFPVNEYRGTKSILITTRTVMGGRNPFLGIAYLVVGGLCIVLGGIFTVTHLFKPRKLGDHTYLSWNNAPTGKTATTAAIATGRDA